MKLLLVLLALSAAGCGSGAPNAPRAAAPSSATTEHDDRDPNTVADAQDEPDADSLVKEAEAATARKAQGEALALYEKALAIEPANDDVIVRVAEILGELNRKGEGRDRLRAYVAAHASAGADVWDALGWAELESKEIARGEAAFKAALRVAHDKDAEAYYGLAIVAADRGDAGATEKALVASFALDPAKRLEAARDEAFEDVRKSPRVRALFTKEKLAEAARAKP